MKEREAIALLVAFAELLGDQDAPEAKAGRVWQTGGHPHVRDWAWHPQGPAAWRTAGRFQRMRKPRGV